ncbi:helix-turn-helix transcriptional regulator [Stutzerimonas urumqiensis]|uniref:helix-turn-helix domain-containing protein n=1 Tax=Stutzerimonas urumqiensis TaxID=638269 RepID=UPI003BA9C7F0
MDNAQMLDDMPREFGARLKQERERLGLQIHELAHLAGITDYMQKRFENGTSVISIHYLQALAAQDIDVMFVISAKRNTMRRD